MLLFSLVFIGCFLFCIQANGQGTLSQEKAEPGNRLPGFAVNPISGEQESSGEARNRCHPTTSTLSPRRSASTRFSRLCASSMKEATLKSPVSDSPGIPSPGNISPSSHRRNISAPFWMRKLLMRLRFPTLKNAMIRSGWKSSGSF